MRISTISRMLFGLVVTVALCLAPKPAFAQHGGGGHGGGGGGSHGGGGGGGFQAVVSTAVVAEELRAVLAVAIMPAAVAAGRIAVLEAVTIAVVVLAGTLVVDMRVARTAAVIGIAARTAGAIEPGRQWRRGQRIPMPVAGTRLAARPEPTGVHHQIARWQPIVL